MSRRFIWKVEPIVDNDKFSILGLLEDFHRFSEGLPARKDPNYFADGPFLRRYETPANLLSEKKNSGPTGRSQISNDQKIGTQNLHSTQGEANIKHHQGPLSNAASGGMLQFKLSEDQKYRDRSRSMSPADLMKIIQNKPQSPEGFTNSGQALFFSAGGHQGVYHIPQNQQPVWSEKQTTQSYKSSQVEYQQYMQENHDGHKHTFESAYSSTGQQKTDEMAHEQSYTDPKTALVVKILLLTNLPKVVERETWDSPIWTLFSDGLIMTQVVEKLELREVGNINKTPRTNAACLNNIKRVVSFLRDNKPKVDPTKLHIENQILEGDPDAIFAFFEQVNVAYSVHLQKLEQRVYREKYDQTKEPKLDYPRITDAYVLDRDERKKHLVKPTQLY